MLPKLFPNISPVEQSLKGCDTTDSPLIPTPDLTGGRYLAMKMHKHDQTARLPFPELDSEPKPVASGVQPRCLHLPAKQTTRLQDSTVEARIRDMRAPIPLHQLDIQTLLRGSNESQRVGEHRVPRAQLCANPRDIQAPYPGQTQNRGSDIDPLRLQSTPLWGDEVQTREEFAGPITQPRREVGRGNSSPRLTPSHDRGSVTAAEPASARAVRQREVCAFYLDIVGAVTVMTLVVLAAILI